TGRTDKPSRSRIVSLAPAIPEELSGRDPHDLARPRVPEQPGGSDCGDRPPAVASLPRELGQLRRAEGSARSATPRGLQESTARDRVAATFRGPFSGEGDQGVTGAE